MKLLFDHFDKLAEATGGVKKLRELILQLAVQGKLVPQDPKDEPVSILLEKIRTERKKTKQGKTKNKNVLDSNKESQSHEIPKNWEWVNLGELGNTFNGNSINAQLKEAKYSKIQNGLPYIATKDVGYRSDKLIYDNGITIPFNEPKFKIAHKGAVLICSEGGSAGKKLGITTQDICFGNKLYAIETVQGVTPGYIFYYYQCPSFKDAFEKRMTGIIGGISINKFVEIPTPLPPLAEQKRIVAKVDALMTLCDDLEKQQQEKAERKLLLNKSSLNALSTSATKQDFNKNWNHIEKNFDLLYSTPKNIDDFKQTILQLAVMGKLVPQDPNDESASVLLEKIQAEKERLIKERKIKKQKSLDPIKESDIPFEVPNGWEWVRLGEIIKEGPQNGFSPKPANAPTAIKAITLSATTTGKFNGAFFKYLPENIIISENAWLKNGDFLVQRGNALEYVGVTALYCGVDNQYIYPDLMMRFKIFKQIHKSFLHDLALSPYAREHLRNNASGTSGTMPKINQSTLINLPIAIPPAFEQKRIAAKVDSLMTLCDQLKENLINKGRNSEKLLNAVVSQL